MYYLPPFIMIVFLTIILCFSTGCSPYPPPQMSSQERLDEIRDKNFSVLRTEMAMRGMNMNSPMLIRAFKEEMELELWVKSSYSSEYKLFKTYQICKKSGVLGPKLKEGDLQTPEGFYAVTPGRLNPNSRFFLSFNIGYPNEYDRAHNRTGSLLMIHGACVSEGCLAMTDKNIGEIYLIVEHNFKYGHSAIPIHMFPFRMTKENMDNHRYSNWYPFWKSLKKGYDYFEHYRRPPDVSVRDGEYVMNQGEYY